MNAILLAISLSIAPGISKDRTNLSKKLWIFKIETTSGGPAFIYQTKYVYYSYFSVLKITFYELYVALMVDFLFVYDENPRYAENEYILGLVLILIVTNLTCNFQHLDYAYTLQLVFLTACIFS